MCFVSVFFMTILLFIFFFFFFNDTATTEIYTLSLHDALPISTGCASRPNRYALKSRVPAISGVANRENSAWPLLMSRRSEEHTSELQSRLHLVCRLLLEKKKKKKQ